MSTPEIHRRLVDRLVGDVRPMRPLRQRWLFLAWVVLQVTALVTLLVYRLRPDVGTMLQRAPFVAQMIALLVSGTLAAWLATRGAFPDRAAGPLSLGAVVALAIFGLVPFGSRTPMLPDAFIAMGLPCFTMTIMTAAVPWVALLLLVGRGACVIPARTGLLAGMAAFLLAAVGMRAACLLDEPLHLLVWHGAPAVSGGALSAILGAVWLGRWAVPGSAGEAR